ncbi:MAG TPA: dienelactone hydrolase family protein [Acidimicrobiia bacterium]|nr:dienelactone hydrolase family protein [Acidimicrobiia bacterium]
MAFEEYVQKEIVADCAEGYLTRREALRRLMVLGVGATAAGVMLAGCSDDDDDSEADAATSTTLPSSTATTAGGAAAPAGPAPLGTEPITFAGPAGELKGSWSAAPEPKGAVLIVHENTGLTPHFVSMPGRLAASGYSALAIDLLSRKGGTAAFPDSAQATAGLTGVGTGIPTADLVADLKAGIDQVLHRAAGHTVGVMGFCFGGGMVWSLLAAGEKRVAAAVPFYGPLPEGADFSGAKAAVLAFYAENDTRVNDTRQSAVAALEAAKLTHEVVVEPGTGHAFFNDTRPERYNAAAATDAYGRLLGWFGKHLS